MRERNTRVIVRWAALCAAGIVVLAWCLGGVRGLGWGLRPGGGMAPNRAGAIAEVGRTRGSVARVPAGAETPQAGAGIVSILVREAGSALPVAGASLTLFQDGIDVRKLVSDENGRALAPELDWPRVVLDVESEDHFGRRLSSSELIDELDEGRRILVELQPFGSLLVRVADEDGEPVRGAFVEVLPADPRDPAQPIYRFPWPESQPPGHQTVGRPTRSAVPSATDANGELRFPYLPCATPLIVRATLNVPEASTSVVIPRDARQANVELTLVRSGRLVGRLVWDGGTPAAGVEVACYAGQNSPWALTDTTDEDGRFHFEHVRYGQVDWRPNLLGEPARAAQVDSATADIGTVSLAARAVVEGRVADGNPPGRSVFALQLESEQGPLGEARTRLDGSFRLLVPLAPTRLTVLLDGAPLTLVEVDPPAENLVIDVSARIGRLAFRPVGVEPGQPVEVGLRRVADPGGEPGRALVVATDDADKVLNARVPRIEWQGGKVVVTALTPGSYEGWVQAGERGGAWIEDTAVEAGQTVDLGLLPVGWGSLAVSCASGAYETLSGIRLEAAGPRSVIGGAAALHGTSNGSAPWHIERALPGPWRVAPLGAEDAGAAQAFVRAGDQAEVVLMGDRPAALAGTLSVGGIPEPGVSISLRAARSPDRILLEETTDALGAFAFSGLAAGTYVVRAAVGSPVPVVVEEVTLRPGQTATADLELDAETRTVRFLCGGLPDATVVSASVWQRGRWANLRPLADGGYAMPRWSGPCLFRASRVGVPGSGYVGHPRITAHQTSVAWARVDAGDTTVSVSLPDPSTFVRLCDLSVEHIAAFVVAAPDHPELGELTPGPSLQVRRREGSWVAYGVEPGLQVAVSGRCGETHEPFHTLIVAP